MDDPTAEQDADDIERFRDACRGEHDADPDAWHRAMLAPIRTRSTCCAFCGMPWERFKVE